jgi:hypothetical protein
VIKAFERAGWVNRGQSGIYLKLIEEIDNISRF